MRIVDVNPYFYPLLGGIEHRMHDTSKLLAEKGHEVIVLTSQLPGTDLEEKTPYGYRIVRLKSRFLNIYNPPYVSSKGVANALEELDADVINYNYRWAPSYNKPMGRYKGKKVFTYHNMWGEGIGVQAFMSEINDNMFRKNLDTYDHIICVSDGVRNDLIRRGIAPSMTTTVPCGLNDMPEPSTEEGDFILSLGRLVRTKGLDYLIEAMPFVDSKIVICGKGPDAKRIEKKIKKLGLEDKVVMKGWVTEEEKNALMSTCKFFVIPSLFESYGLAAVELMSHRRPVICTDVNGLPETVGNGGLVVRSKDVKGLANAMNELSSDRDLRIKLGNNARQRAEEYNWKNHIDKIENVYKKVVNG